MCWLLALLLLATHSWAQDVICGRCVGVTVGDTIRTLTADQQLLRIRIAWIDAPELGQAFGRRAKKVMSALVFDSPIILLPDSKVGAHLVLFSKLCCSIITPRASNNL